jgi:hypothetical protein
VDVRDDPDSGQGWDSDEDWTAGQRQPSAWDSSESLAWQQQDCLGILSHCQCQKSPLPEQIADLQHPNRGGWGSCRDATHNRSSLRLGRSSPGEVGLLACHITGTQHVRIRILEFESRLDIAVGQHVLHTLLDG